MVYIDVLNKFFFFMLGSDVLFEFDDCEVLKGFRFRDDGGVLLILEGDVLFCLFELLLDGEFG